MANDDNQRRRKAFREFMSLRGLNPHKVSTDSKVPYSTIKSFLYGKTKSLSGNNERKIARTYGTSVEAMYGEDYDSPAVKDVWIKGVVGAGAKVTLWDSGMGEGEGYSRVPWPIGVPMNEDLIAFEIRGDSMPPYSDGDLVYLEQSDALPGPEIIGKLCVVELDNGDMLIKMVRRGYTEGRYNLHSFDGRPPIDDAHVIRAARVRAGTYK